MFHYKRPEMHDVKPGETVVVKGCWSEMMLGMRLADTFMPVTILANGYGQLLDPKTGRDFSMPSPLSWISNFYQRDESWYGTEVYEIGVGRTVTHSPGKFYIYVDGRKLWGVQSLRFEEMRDEARAMHARGIETAEVRFVENSRHLDICWSQSVVVPLDTETRSRAGRNSLGQYRDTWMDLPTHFNLFAGRYFQKEN